MSDSETDEANSGLRPDSDREITLDDPIIDLTDPEATWDRIENETNPFERLSQPQRMRLMIRVLCELVAFDEIEDEQGATGGAVDAGASGNGSVDEATSAVDASASATSASSPEGSAKTTAKAKAKAKDEAATPG